ncbi:hypothetical protein CH063_07910 [Colletotrichum higginsianum]|uniref:Uncharacterized protein n=1 Tax=Colletotrichum higginsianum (strain IMI 349063) TaxID=759273 RepID=H1V7V7_COLHI|nr:hypothetical protein CH063_07910 [Colletotrichum higginsianum]
MCSTRYFSIELGTKGHRPLPRVESLHHDMMQEDLCGLPWPCFGTCRSSAQQTECACGPKHSAPRSMTLAFRFAHPSP